MNKELEQITGTTDKQADSAEGTAAPVSDVSRRRFTRGAVVTGAVLASLGNRAAWAGKPEVCVSDPTWLSYTNAKGSVSAGTIEQMEELEKALRNPNTELVHDSDTNQRCARHKP